MASRRINRVPPGPGDPRHGEYRGYIAGCRQPCCVAAERAYQRKRSRMLAYKKPLKVPSIGTVRRVQALMAMGHSGEKLAPLLGISQRTNLPTHTRYETIRAGTAEKAKQVYEQLKDLPGDHSRTEERAREYGFLPPAAWEGIDMDDPDALPIDLTYEHEQAGPDIDEVAIERRLSGDPVRLNREEQIEAVLRAHRAGMEDISRVLRMNPQTVTKILKEHTA